jgi:hypothetical protein
LICVEAVLNIRPMLDGEAPWARLDSKRYALSDSSVSVPLE